MLIIFDLDGTIIESGKGIIDSFKYSFEKMGMEIPSMKELESYIGPPLDDTFNNKFNFSEEESKKALGYYREFYSQKGKYECEVYDGIFELIKELSKDHTLAVGTSKIQDSAIDILEYFGLADCFTFIGGSAIDKSRNTKAKVIEHVLKHIKNYEIENTYMIGDRFYDIEGAKRHGLKTIGVEWGYGGKEELLEAGADYVVANTKELKTLINKFK